MVKKMDLSKNTTKTDHSMKKEPTKMAKEMDFGKVTTKTDNSGMKKPTTKMEN